MFGRMLITDFTGVYGDEGFPAALDRIGVPFERVDFSGIEGTKCYCSGEASEQIRARLPEEPEGGIHWIDSGDYHYMSFFFCERIRVPFTLLLLDHHPDDQESEFGDMLSCGGWVRSVKRSNPFLREVITVGPDGAMPDFSHPFEAVYVSLDKDILSRDEARTDWSQGTFCLGDVFHILDGVRTLSDRILGMDICGEIPVRNGGTPEDLRINLETNLKLVNKLNEIFI